MRKRCHRQIRPALPPRALRAKLSTEQIRMLNLAHWTNLDAIAHGTADEATLWHWAGGAYTWSRCADLLEHEEAKAAMQDQLLVCAAVIHRYGRTGCIGFSGPEYQRAKDACEWMDAISRHVDGHTALQAAEWSERHINGLQRGPVEATA